MYKKIIKYTVSVVLGILFLSCNNVLKKEKEPVAEVGEKKLFHSDLAEIIPSDIDPADSSLLADDFVKKWIKQELLIQKADENLTFEQKNVTKELQEYRSSLIIYKYKNELMKQKMDTTVSNEQIENYYNTHSENFNLDKNIVKALFVKIPNEVANPELLKELVKDTSEEGLNELRDYCVQYSKKFDIFIDNWVDFEIVKNNIPQEIPDVKHFLSGNNQIELNDSNYYYLVNIQEYKLQNDLAPLDFVENSIKNLILNQRKIQFLRAIEDNVYKEGIRQNKFKIYTTKTNETN